MEILKFYRYWVLRNGYNHLFMNFLRVTDMYRLLKDMSTRMGMEKEFVYFFSKPVKLNRHFSEDYLGRLTEDWHNRKGINYELYLKGLFNER